MFGLLTKKQIKVFSPVDGKVIALSEVPDAVFAQKMLGDGIAVLPTSNIIKAPVDGTIKMIFKTNHAFTIATSDGIEILVHIGVDTIELNGEGFTRLIQEGTKVKSGTPVLNVDLNVLKTKGKHTAVPVLVVTMDKISQITSKEATQVQAGLDEIITCTLK